MLQCLIIDKHSTNHQIGTKESSHMSATSKIRNPKKDEVGPRGRTNANAEVKRECREREPSNPWKTGGWMHGNPVLGTELASGSIEVEVAR